MKVLVTGGAGYVGSLVCEALAARGDEVVVLDNLQQGHRDSVPENAEFVRADIRNPDELSRVFHRHAIDAVMHMAADSLVELSMTDPGSFFRNNVSGGLNLLDVMLEHKVNRIIFSSSAAVYGKPDVNLIEETEPTVPVNPYGESKLIFERILKWYGKAHGLRHVSLRYFNAAGASEKRGEDHRPETHLIPNILKAAFNDKATLNIFGTDYPTRDGTCVRDYVHVADIAGAHALALEKIDHLNDEVYNLGNGEGYSVSEVVDAAKRVTGANIALKACPRREGDPPVLVASSERARNELGWVPKYNSIESIVETAWRWLKKYPEGYAQ
jgi:UDP-glucose 4-epimerase